MHGHVRKALLLRALAALCLVAAIGGAASLLIRTLQIHEVASDTYYVDCSASLEGAGTLDSPWNSLETVNEIEFAAGSQILFKSGMRCEGTLSPKGSGKAGKPIIIDRYGDGDKPLIAGNGAANAVYLYNQEYWEVRNLEITNDSAQASNRRGVYVVAENMGAARYFRLVNLAVHHVKGDNTKNQGGSGGIMFEVQGLIQKTWFEDVIIDGCTVYTADRTGITTDSSWRWRPAIGSKINNWVGWTDFVIRNNTVYDIGGDGIVIRNTRGARVEYNVVYDANMRSGEYCAGIWPWNSDDTVFQYNEAYRVRTMKDGFGFNVDFGTTGTIFQYNYSHDNEGGFMLICTPSNRANQDAIIRYNISQNDNARIFSFHGSTVNTQIYNNTVYIGPGKRVRIVEQEPYGLGDTQSKPVSAYFYNNILYNEGNALYLFTQGTANVFDYNLFYGRYAQGEPEDLHKLVEDPWLVDPGSGGTGLDTLGGYQLQEGSPAIGSGKIIEGNGGQDFWGNPVPQDAPPDRGAHQYSAPGR
ncbi:MAG: right-handed parallel beta-helix repeat-containing protein [Anaerolineales bacterium]|nr:right-handed parallel beta-helix repeat-containing protein [Anaerolineales bacterium]